jgi:phospholipase/lecithinase/hemolysin
MKIRVTLGALALAVLAACGGGGNTVSPPAPSTNTTSRIVAFGDSLTDGGTYSRANSAILQSAAGIPAAAANTVGKFTNSPGSVWVEVLASKLSLTIAPERFEVGAANPVAATNGANSAANATNYAQGGSRVAGFPGIGCNPNAAGVCTGNAAVPVSTQIDRALAKGNFQPTDLVLYWAGANDVFHNATLASNDLTAATIAAGRALTATEQQAILGKYVIAMEEAGLATMNQLRRLKAAGAQRIVVMTIPNAANSPYGDANAAAKPLLTALSSAYNDQLKKEIALNDPGVLLFDAGALATAYRNNPAANGFTNVTIPVCNVPTAFGNSSSFCSSLITAWLYPVPAATSLFADGVHPSLAAHDKFGNAVLEALRQKAWVK